MFDRPILFYSEYCVHSTNFLNTLMKHPDIYEAFIRISIDVEPNTKSRPKIFYDIQTELGIKISEVPTVITPGPEYVLTGADAFDWLQSQISSTNTTSEELQGFNPVEMGSFSDSYSTYGSNDLTDAKEQTFKFLGRSDDCIETPPETGSVSKDDYARKQHERESFDNVHFSGKGPGPGSAKGPGPAKGPGSAQRPGSAQGHNFGGNSGREHFGNSGGNFGGKRMGNVSEKQMEMDDRYQRLLAERESFGQTVQRT